jgi:hypothetical protein
MRYTVAGLSIGVVCLAGCNLPWLRPSQAANTGIPVDSLKADRIVASLNANAGLVRSLECHDVDLTCTQGALQSVNLRAYMVCQKPRDFRLRGQVMNNTMVDVGSNNHEFWWWIGKADPPYLYHCSHEDFRKSQGRIQLPFQPDWIMETLGMAEYDPSKPYQLVSRGNSLELIEQAISPQGKPVRKVTVVSRNSNNNIQVTAHVLQDERGKEIATARVLQVRRDPTSGAILPMTVEMRWPAEKVVMKLALNDSLVNGPLPAQRTERLFARPNLEGVRSVDLARGPDGPAGNPVRRASGYYR